VSQLEPTAEVADAAAARFLLSYGDGRRERDAEAAMKVYSLSEEECYRILAEAGFGRLACARDDQPYVVPIYFVVGDGFIYSFALPGQKIEWMRQNPRVCIETDHVVGATDWTSIVAFGRYTELEESPHFSRERARAHLLLQGRPMWWEPGAIPVEGADEKESYVPVFYRVTVERITGYRAVAHTLETEPRAED
jgi:uncharacterized protein